MNRRGFLAGLTASAAGLLIPERKIWALDQTMIPTSPRMEWVYSVPQINGGLLTYTDVLAAIQEVYNAVTGRTDHNYYQQFWVSDDLWRLMQ